MKNWTMCFAVLTNKSKNYTDKEIKCVHNLQVGDDSTHDSLSTISMLHNVKVLAHPLTVCSL